MKISVDDRVWFVVAEWPRANIEGEWLRHREIWRVGPFESLDAAQTHWERDFSATPSQFQPKAFCYIELTLKTDGSVIQTQKVMA